MFGCVCFFSFFFNYNNKLFCTCVNCRRISTINYYFFSFIGLTKMPLFCNLICLISTFLITQSHHLMSRPLRPPRLPFPHLAPPPSVSTTTMIWISRHFRHQQRHLLLRPRPVNHHLIAARSVMPLFLTLSFYCW